MDSQPSSANMDQSMDLKSFEKRNLYVAEILGMWNLSDLVRKLGTREECLAFAEEQGLIPTSKMCSYHHKPMRINYKFSHIGGFVCNKGVCLGKNRVSRAKGTWFENVKLDLPKVFYLMYAYAHRFSYCDAVHEDYTKGTNNKCLSRVTVQDWYSYFREAVVTYQLDMQVSKGKIGGPGVVVQIDQSKFGKKKNFMGRSLEGHWVLGLIEDGSEDLRLEVSSEDICSAEVLVPLVLKHVEAGSIIHTDSWSAYDCLSEYGYIHKKVNHSDPDNPFVAEDGTHTQRITSQWRVVKHFFQKDNCYHSENFTNLIVEYLWRRRIVKEKKDPYLEVIKAIKHVCK